MQRIEGRIEEIRESQDRKGDIYYIVKVEGQSTGFFVWDARFLKGVKLGDNVQIDFTDSKYPKIVKLIKLPFQTENGKNEQAIVHLEEALRLLKNG